MKSILKRSILLPSGVHLGTTQQHEQRPKFQKNLQKCFMALRGDGDKRRSAVNEEAGPCIGSPGHWGSATRWLSGQ